MDRLDEIMRVLEENETKWDIENHHPHGECETVFSIQSGLSNPYARLSMALIRDSNVVSTGARTAYGRLEGKIPTSEDLLQAHLKSTTERRNGPPRKLTFEIDYRARRVASAQYVFDTPHTAEQKFALANAHIKTELANLLGDETVILGKKHSSGYIHVTGISSKKLGIEPFHFADPISCAKFMHAAYRVLVKTLV